MRRTPGRHRVIHNTTGRAVCSAWCAAPYPYPSMQDAHT